MVAHHNSKLVGNRMPGMLNQILWIPSRAHHIRFVSRLDFIEFSCNFLTNSSIQSDVIVLPVATSNLIFFSPIVSSAERGKSMKETEENCVPFQILLAKSVACLPWYSFRTVPSRIEIETHS